MGLPYWSEFYKSDSPSNTSFDGRGPSLTLLHLPGIVEKSKFQMVKMENEDFLLQGWGSRKQELHEWQDTHGALIGEKSGAFPKLKDQLAPLPHHILALPSLLLRRQVRFAIPFLFHTISYTRYGVPSFHLQRAFDASSFFPSTPWMWNRNSS